MKKSEIAPDGSKASELDLSREQVSSWLFRIWVIAVLFGFVSCGLARGGGSFISAASGSLSGSWLWLGIAGCLILAGWCTRSLRRESSAYFFFVCLIIAILPCVELLERNKYFDSLQSFTLWMASLLAGVFGQTNVIVDDHVLFRNFTADQFSCLGRWNGVVSCLGMGVVCVLSFRRRLVSACLTLVASVLVWPVFVSASCIIMSFLAPASEMPLRATWSLCIEWICAVLGVLIIFGVDHFAAAFFKPIPSKLLRSETPFFSYAWNWLCGLPDPIYRAGKQISSSGQHPSKFGVTIKKASLRADFRWLRREVVCLFVKPFRAIRSVMDAASSWRASRRWTGLMFGTPAILAPLIAYMALPILASTRDGSQLRKLEQESLSACSNQILESACHKIQEEKFAKAIGGAMSKPVVDLSTAISQHAMRYTELLSRRILCIERKNQMARYRLGLIMYLNDEIENAKAEMQQSASRELGDFPQADAWLAKNLVIQKASGHDISESELHLRLENAIRNADCDFRLLFLYSSLLETKGALGKAVEIAKLGVKARPETILDLARLYTRLGDAEGRLSASKKAETYFSNQLKSDDNERYRLAIADARLLQDQLVGAAEILEDGVRKNICGDKSRRQISEIQRMLYLGSIRKNEKGEVDVDLEHLEKASDWDSSNPNISSEVSKLLAIKAKPTKKLLDTLQRQVKLGIATAACHLILGEKYFAMGKLNDAREHWESALEKEPNNVTALNNLANCLTAISLSNVDRSIELVTMADSLSPNNADILDTWGEVSLAANRPRDAVNKFELAIKNDSKRTDIRKKLIVAYQAAGLNAMAATQLELVQRLEPVAISRKK